MRTLPTLVVALGVTLGMRRGLARVLGAMHVRSILSLVAVLLTVVVPASAKDKRVPIAVYVFTLPPSDGFTDSDVTPRQDSVGDLNKQLRLRRVKLATDAEHADILIEITDRLVGRARDAALTTPNGTSVVVVPPGPRLNTLTATLRFGTITRDLRSAGLAMWKDLARSMAKEIDVWIKDNEGKIRAQLVKK